MISKTQTLSSIGLIYFEWSLLILLDSCRFDQPMKKHLNGRLIEFIKLMTSTMKGTEKWAYQYINSTAVSKMFNWLIDESIDWLIGWPID